MSGNKAPAWVVPVMRAGYGGRGLIYLLVGGLTLAAALRGGPAGGTGNALAALRAQPLGLVALWVIAAGMACYAVWRLVDAALDLEDYGHDLHGLTARLGQATTGLLHAGLGASAAALALGMGGSGGGRAEDWTARVMSLPYGAWIAGAAGLIVLGAGGYYMRKGARAGYRGHLHRTALTRRLDPAMQAGLIAQGIVVAILGGFLLWAALSSDPQEAGGLGDAFSAVRSLAFGRGLLGALAAGLLGFSLYNFVEAAYRIVPRRTGPGIASLAQAAG